MADTTPLLVTAEVRDEHGVLDRTFYWLNYQKQSGCLFDLPKAEVVAMIRGNQLVLRNVSSVPAVGVTVECPQNDETFTISDNFFWLEAGEEVTLAVNTVEGLTISGMNLCDLCLAVW